MSLAADSLDDIRTFNRQRGPSCQAGLILAAMDPAIRETVMEAIADPAIERAAIVRWLKDRKGIVVSLNSFLRHAAGECRCG
jgi:hypothetical protein